MSNNYFIIVLRQVILLPLYHGSASSPCFSPSSDWAGAVGTPDSEDSTSPFFCRKSVHYCSNCFHRITAIFSQGRSKNTLRRSKDDIGATMNIFISVTPDTRCSLTCFHGHLLQAVVISPPHPFTKLRGFSHFRQSLWRAFKIKRRKKNRKKFDVSLTRGTIGVTPSLVPIPSTARRKVLGSRSSAACFECASLP